MDTSALKKFAQSGRQARLEQVTSKLVYVLKESRLDASTDAVAQLEKAAEKGKGAQVAYTWFNRVVRCGLWTSMATTQWGCVAVGGQVQPEILAEAKSGVIDDTLINTGTMEKIRGLLGGSIPSPDAQSEAYRLLIVGSCNALYGRMFERIQEKS